MRFIVVPFSTYHLEGTRHKGNIWLVIDTESQEVVDWSYVQQTAYESRVTFERHSEYVEEA